MNETNTAGTTTPATPQTKEERKEAILEQIKKIIFDNCDVEIWADDLDGINDTDDLYNDSVERAISEQTEIIYYSRAIEYLSENDPSLTESLAIALEFGYGPEDLNSERLASLLNYQNTLDTFWTLRYELDELIDERHEIDDEEDDE